MSEDARVLRLHEMLLRQKGPLARRVVHFVVTVALRLYFRRIETSGAGRVPASGVPVVFVLNHPNGLIDPALVFCALPRRISFLAKSTLFGIPFVGWLMRVVEALPLYRRVDEGQAVEQNRRTFRACREILRRGRCIALFPEGRSHNEPQLLPVKSGAARIALGAISVGGDEHDAPHTDDQVAPHEGGPDDADRFDLKIVPVGLYYTSKTSFRSEALLRFGEALEVHPVELDEEGEPPREAVHELSARIEAALREVTLNVEDEGALEVTTKAEQLFSSIYEGINIERSLAARFDFLRSFAAVRRLQHQHSPERVERLRQRINRYEEELREIGIAPENLSLSSHSAWHVFRHFIFRAGLLLIFSPLSVVGAILHLPAYLLSDAFARWFPTHGVDEARSTVKISLAIMLMPLTWLAVAAVVYFLWGWRVALLAFPAAIVCGYAAMRSLEALYDMRGWFKALLLLVRRRGLFLRLLWERRALHNEIRQLSQ